MDLDTFYQTTIRLFPNSTRLLSDEKDPKFVFPESRLPQQQNVQETEESSARTKSQSKAFAKQKKAEAKILE